MSDTDRIRFRALPLREAPARVDREARTISGVSCAQAVEALGHGMMLDDTSIAQLVAFGNKKKSGVKSRFTHPGLSSDGLGKYLGRLKNFRQEGDKALADLHLSELSFKSPGGNLGDYVMDLADESPDSFGMSVVIDVQTVWPMEDGSERKDDGEGRPRGAMTAIPVARIVDFVACDAVDEPAANRDGMFSASLWASNQLAEGAFTDIDEYLSELGIAPDKAFQFALKYFNARGVKLQEFKSMENEEVKEVETSAELTTLQAQIEAMQAQMAALAEAEAEAKLRAETLTKSLDEANKRNSDLEIEARTKRFETLAKNWTGDKAGHVEVLTELGEGSKAFQFYVQQQNAVVEQLDKGALFAELGNDKPGENLSAVDQLEAIAKRLQTEDPKLSAAQAMSKAAELNPKLYAEYRKG